MINGSGAKADHDAARRVATSSEARKNRFETAAFQEGDRGERPVGFNLLGSFPFCGQIAFNYAIPFLEDRSDAACRVV